MVPPEVMYQSNMEVGDIVENGIMVAVCPNGGTILAKCLSFGDQSTRIEYNPFCPNAYNPAKKENSKTKVSFLDIIVRYRSSKYTNVHNQE